MQTVREKIVAPPPPRGGDLGRGPALKPDRAGDVMLEIISILAAAVPLIATPIQTGQVCAGKINPKFKGSPAEYAVAFRRQLGLFVYLGAVCGVVNLALIFLNADSAEWMFDLLGAALWLGVAAVSYQSRRRLARLPAPAQGGGASA